VRSVAWCQRASILGLCEAGQRRLGRNLVSLQDMLIGEARLSGSGGYRTNTKTDIGNVCRCVAIFTKAAGVEIRPTR